MRIPIQVELVRSIACQGSTVPSKGWCLRSTQGTQNWLCLQSTQGTWNSQFPIPVRIQRKKQPVRSKGCVKQAREFLPLGCFLRGWELLGTQFRNSACEFVLANSCAKEPFAQCEFTQFGIGLRAKQGRVPSLAPIPSRK